MLKLNMLKIEELWNNLKKKSQMLQVFFYHNWFLPVWFIVV